MLYREMTKFACMLAQCHMYLMNLWYVFWVIRDILFIHETKDILQLCQQKAILSILWPQPIRSHAYSLAEI